MVPEKFVYTQIIYNLGLEDHLPDESSLPNEVIVCGQEAECIDGSALKIVYGLVVPSYMIMLSKYMGVKRGDILNQIFRHEVKPKDKSLDHPNKVKRNPASSLIGAAIGLLSSLDPHVESPSYIDACTALAAIGLLAINSEELVDWIDGSSERPNEKYIQNVEEWCKRHPLTEKLFYDSKEYHSGLPNWGAAVLIEGEFDNWTDRLEHLEVEL